MCNHSLFQIIQAIFFFICILNDWFGTNAVSPKKPPFIRKLKDHVHAILGFPIAMVNQEKDKNYKIFTFSKKLKIKVSYIFVWFSRIIVRWNNILDFNVCGSRIGASKGAGSLLSMVAQSFDAHNDHGFHANRNDDSPEKISKEIIWPFVFISLYDCIFNLVRWQYKKKYNNYKRILSLWSTVIFCF